MNTNSHNAMNSTPNSDSGPDCGPYCGDDTLRLIAGLPAPAGLEERVHKALRAAPRSGRILAWPAGLRAKSVMESNWMRAAAAAAIVFVVVGGGWGVYSRVQPGPAGKVIVMPQLMPHSGGISGAIRTPVTIPGPTVKTPAKKAAAAKKAATSQHATGLHPASVATPQPAVSQ